MDRARMVEDTLKDSIDDKDNAGARATPKWWPLWLSRGSVACVPPATALLLKIWEFAVPILLGAHDCMF